MQVLVAAGFHLVGELHDPGRDARDLQRDVDRALPRFVHVLAGAQRVREPQVACGVELDQPLGAEAHLLSFVVGLARPVPLARTERHLLQQGGGRRCDRSSRRSAGWGGRR
jgi:hypothetical protein